MRILHGGLAGLALVAAAWSCGGSDTAGTGGGTSCTPGASVACTGPRGCSGFQVCKPDGSAFDACDCGSGGGSSTTSGSGPGGAGGSTSGANGGAGGASTSSGAGGSSSGGGGGGTFSPTDLTGLSLWLTTDMGLVPDPMNMGMIEKWQDQSSHHHLASGGDCSIDPVALNGHDALNCYGGPGFKFNVPDPDGSLKFGTGDFTIAMVITAPNIDETNTATFWTSSGVTLVTPNTGAFSAGVGPDGVAGNASAMSTFHLAVFGRKGATVFLDMDASSSSTPETMHVDLQDGAVGLVNPQSNNNQNVEIVEVLVNTGSLTDAEVTKLRDYFHEKFGL